MISHTQLSEFVEKIGQIYRPDNLGKKYDVRELINDIPTCSKLLIELINSEENDESLERLDKDFHTHLKTIFELSDLEKLPIAIEGLAQKYEAFIKKIAFLKYKNTEIWSGNETSVGLTGTTFKDLCVGIIQNKPNIPESIPKLTLSEPLIKYQGVTRSLLDFTRQKLRNAVHYAPEINRKDLIPYSEIVVLVYLFSVQDNFHFLSQKFLPEFKYKIKLIEHFRKWNELYVELDSKYKSPSEFLELASELNELDWLYENENSIKIHKGSINEVFTTINRLVILGAPGQGKTTLLQFLGYQIASGSDILPIYFPLKEFDHKGNLFEQLAESIGITANELEDLCNLGRVAFLLDGLNEVIFNEGRVILNNQLVQLIRKNLCTPIAISSRPSDYQNELGLPVFELIPLSNERIQEYLRKYYDEQGLLLYQILATSPRLIDLCRNPLLLKILGSIFLCGKVEIPENKGLLIKNFIDTILIREKSKNILITPDKLKCFLKYLGYHTRVEEKVSFDIDNAINIINIAAKEIDPLADRIKIIGSLVDLNLLSRNIDKLSFSHELFQEYFAAEGLKQFASMPEVIQLSDKPHWDQPIIMYSGLIDSRSEFIKILSKSHPLLATDCALTSINEEKELQENLVKINLINATKLESNKIASEAIISLIKLGHSEKATNAIEENFKKIGRKAFSYYQNITHEIITKVDLNHLSTTIEILLSIDVSFTNMILRGIDSRQESELLDIQDQIGTIMDKFDLQRLSTKYLTIFLKLAADSNVELIKKIGLRVIGNYKQIKFPILKIFIDKNLDCSEDLIEAALKSTNINLQSDAILHCIKLGLEKKFYNQLQSNFIYKNEKYKTHLEKVGPDWQSYLDGISWVYKEIKFKELQDSLNNWILCKVIGINKHGYISLIIIGYPHFCARIYKKEILDKNKFQPGFEVTLRISYVNINREIVLLSQKSEGNINYLNINQSRKQVFTIGQIVDCVVVTKIVPNYIQVITKSGHNGSIHIRQVSDEYIPDLKCKFQIGQELKVSVLNIDPKYGVQFSIKNLSSHNKKIKQETDISIKLKQALMNKKDSLY